ncbi:hypothetical protein BT69DRAFT_1282563, partial [Atractiella rhizophila]
MAALGHFFLLVVSLPPPLPFPGSPTSSPIALHRPSRLHQARSSEVERAPEVKGSIAKAKGGSDNGSIS